MHNEFREKDLINRFTREPDHIRNVTETDWPENTTETCGVSCQLGEFSLWYEVERILIQRVPQKHRVKYTKSSLAAWQQVSEGQGLE